MRLLLHALLWLLRVLSHARPRLLSVLGLLCRTGLPRLLRVLRLLVGHGLLLRPPRAALRRGRPSGGVARTVRRFAAWQSQHTWQGRGLV